MTERFRCTPAPKGCGKLLALDEAHKFMDGLKSDGLSNTIVSAARMMRHDGLVLSKLCILVVQCDIYTVAVGSFDSVAQSAGAGAARTVIRCCASSLSLARLVPLLAAENTP